MTSPPSARDRFENARFAVARTVLRRRRLLAALCAGLAVWAGVRTAQPPAEPAVLVTVAARDLPAGATLAADDLTQIGFRDGTVPAGAVDDVVGRILAGPVRRGEALTEVRLVGEALNAGHPDLVATPVRLPDAAVASLLRVGDHVDVLAADPQGGPAGDIARSAPVLAIPAPVEGDSLAGRVVVLGLRPSEAGALAAAAVTHFLTVTWSG